MVVSSTTDSIMTSIERYLPIGDYALIGDCHSTALVSRHGSIDWACLRRFDAGSAFARLLDHDKGGHYSIRPVEPVVRTHRRYLRETMVLETTMVTEVGTIVVTDAFTMTDGGSKHPRHELLRMIDCTAGHVVVDVEIKPRFDYGLATPWIRAHGPGIWSAVAGDDAMVIQAECALSIDASCGSLTAQIELDEGAHLGLVLVSVPPHLIEGERGRVDARTSIETTIAWWMKWSKKTISAGPHAHLHSRSALVLKALCCGPTGAIIAAPTTSLPEIVGGSSNWDYRACWIRDATLTLAALTTVGHHGVADGFRRFIMRTAAGDASELQIMYGPYGERRLPEIELDLDGWRGSRPVRTGNAAATQMQLDVYGHLVDATHLWHTRQHDITEDEWTFITAVIEQAVARWHEPDAGIWELRGHPRHYVHSKVMVWVALDRGIRLVQDHGFSGVEIDRWILARDEIRATVDRRGVHPTLGHFVQAFDGESVDASLLKLALVGFVDAFDERMIKTVDAIQQQLGTPDGFIRRQTTRDTSDDDTARHEGVFLLCSFWLVEVLAMQGRVADAKALFERLAGLANDVGLFAEEYSSDDQELLGNFPQAFTHLGLIAAEHRLRMCTEEHERNDHR